MDILTNEFQTYRTGNDILSSPWKSHKRRASSPLFIPIPSAITHMAPAPPIGLWDQQGAYQAKGRLSDLSHTAYSIELNTAVFLPEWNKEIRMMMEEDAFRWQTGALYRWAADGVVFGAEVRERMGDGGTGWKR